MISLRLSGGTDMANNTQQFCEELVQNFNNLGPILIEHVSDNDEILPHVFLGDVTRYVLADGIQRRELVRFLDDRFTKGEKDIRDLIAVSFIENLESEEELEHATQDVKADALCEEWHRQRL